MEKKFRLRHGYLETVYVRLVHLFIFILKKNYMLTIASAYYNTQVGYELVASLKSIRLIKFTFVALQKWRLSCMSILS